MNAIYVNRELSWLKFNQRVLEEANNIGNPLFERLRFLSIVASNLDEFYMVRVGSLFDQALLDNPEVDNKTQMTVQQQLDSIYRETRKSLPNRDKAFRAITEDLRKQGLRHLSADSLTVTEKGFLKTYFDTEIAPLLSPHIIDNKHPFPHLINKQCYIAVLLKHKEKKSLGIIPINIQFLPALVSVPSGKSTKYMLLEELILMYAQRVFRNTEIEDRVIARVTRNADLDAEEAFYDEDNDYREFMKKLIKKRSKLRPVRLELSGKISVEFASLLRKRLKLIAKQVFVLHSPLSYDYINQLEDKLKDKKHAELFYPPLVPQLAPYVHAEESVIEQALQHDIFVSYPFNSALPVIRLLQEAAADPKVAAIKIALYRVASESKIIGALIEAAENGKDVVVALELKARFDEEHNIEWSDKLEEAGCKVIYGVDHYKVHSKIMLILRKEGTLTQTITHVSSGNYNEKTSRLYTDVNIITANREIGNDAIHFFNTLQLGQLSQANEYKYLIASPFGVKNKFLHLIEDEIIMHQAYSDGHIIMKMNSFTDKDVIDKLVEASKLGVKVELIVRGICCVLPGIIEETHNITVRSIVGRFLEHSRIYYFYQHGEEQIYIASADMMTRNTEKRVEVACPILDRHAKEDLKNILNLCLNDTVKARILDPLGNYAIQKCSVTPINSQLILYEQAYQQASEPTYTFEVNSDYIHNEDEYDANLHKIVKHSNSVE